MLESFTILLMGFGMIVLLIICLALRCEAECCFFNTSEAAYFLSGFSLSMCNYLYFNQFGLKR